MQKIGSFLIVTGLLSIVAGFFNRVPKILMWMYKWGDSTAWAIKIGLLVLGAVLYMMSRKAQRS